jgi:hypothetical protein
MNALNFSKKFLIRFFSRWALFCCVFHSFLIFARMNKKQILIKYFIHSWKKEEIYFFEILYIFFPLPSLFLCGYPFYMKPSFIIIRTRQCYCICRWCCSSLAYIMDIIANSELSLLYALNCEEYNCKVVLVSMRFHVVFGVNEGETKNAQRLVRTFFFIAHTTNFILPTSFLFCLLQHIHQTPLFSNIKFNIVYIVYISYQQGISYNEWLVVFLVVYRFLCIFQSSIEPSPLLKFLYAHKRACSLKDWSVC